MKLKEGKKLITAIKLTETTFPFNVASEKDLGKCYIVQ